MDKLKKGVKKNVEKLLVAIAESLINLVAYMIEYFWIITIFLIILLVANIWRILWIYTLREFDFVLEVMVKIVQTGINIIIDAINDVIEAVDKIKDAPENIAHGIAHSIGL